MAIEHQVEKHGLVFVDRGGPYIDVCLMGRPRVAIDAINVWNYEADERRVPHSRAQVRIEAGEWLDENLPYLADYIMSAGG